MVTGAERGIDSDAFCKIDFGADIAEEILVLRPGPWLALVRSSVRRPRQGNVRGETKLGNGRADILILKGEIARAARARRGNPGLGLRVPADWYSIELPSDLP